MNLQPAVVEKLRVTRPVADDPAIYHYISPFRRTRISDPFDRTIKLIPSARGHLMPRHDGVGASCGRYTGTERFARNRRDMDIALPARMVRNAASALEINFNRLLGREFIPQPDILCIETSSL